MKFIVCGWSGVALICVGVGARWGWPWAAMLFGCALLALYILNEVAEAKGN